MSFFGSLLGGGTSQEYDKEEVTHDIQEAASSDDFKNAVKEDSDEGIEGTFEVTDDEMKTIRDAITKDYPNDASYLSDAYMYSVASKPYSKDPTSRRPLDYSIEKLKHVMEWRKEAGAPEMVELLKLANGPTTATQAVENPEKLKKAQAFAKAVNNGSVYWHGFTKDGRPVMWIRTNRKPWYPDVEAEVNALILMADAGIRAMPEGVTDFVCISESSYPPPPNPQFMISVLKALVRGYPDRLHLLISAPVSSIVQFVMNLLLPLMPGRLASKIVLKGLDEAKVRLTDLLQNGERDIPSFLGGTADHDQYYPEESKCPNRGEGNLKFDYFGMVERLQAAKTDYLEWKKMSKE